MDYRVFKERFTNDIIEKLSVHGHKNVKIILRYVGKVNENYETMTVIPDNSSAGVSINIENAFVSYERTRDYTGVIASASKAILNGLDKMAKIDTHVLMCYANMKERLSIEVISAETNAKLLEEIPHETIEDLAVVYRFEVSADEKGRSSILVTNDMIDCMGVSREQLRLDALESAPKIRPAVILGMNEYIKEALGPMSEIFGIPDEIDEVAYVASVPDKMSGAGIIAYPGFLEQAAKKLGGDFFVLPSSIHEVILVPDNGALDAEELRDMVEVVNVMEVKPEEKLTDNVYHYDSKTHVFELAEKFAKRQFVK